jgi:hypothetical protein
MQDDEADVVFRADLRDVGAGEGFDLAGTGASA